MEYIDVVNEDDVVVGVVPYPDVYKKLLLHRIVHILIFNNKEELALQKRSKKKSFMEQDGARQLVAMCNQENLMNRQRIGS